MQNLVLSALLSMPLMLLPTPGERFPCEPALLPKASVWVSPPVEEVKMSGDFLPVALVCPIDGTGKFSLTRMNAQQNRFRVRIMYRLHRAERVKFESRRGTKSYRTIKEIARVDIQSQDDQDAFEKIVASVQGVVTDVCSAERSVRQTYRRTLKANFKKLRAEDQ